VLVSLGLLLGGQEAAELPPSGFGVALLKMVAALVVVCLLAYAALRLARRHLIGLRPRGQGGLLRVVDRCALSARQSLWVVEVAGRYFLIGVADGAIAKLAELDADQLPLPAEGQGRQRSFWELLRRDGPKGGAP
jgi:flagellar biogenesis protein FliO